MFNPKFILATLVLFLVFFIICKRTIKNLANSKSYQMKILPKLKWRKIFFMFYLISFGFYVSIRLFGLFGTDLSKVLIAKENILLLEISIFLIIPIFTGFAILAMSIILSKFKAYDQETKNYLRIITCFIMNRFYLLIVIANIMIGIKSKIF